MAPATGVSNIAGSGPDASMLYTGRWWHHSHIVLLNFILIVPLISSYANGFDGSMMNGLQAVNEWKEFFNNPDDKQLGLFNAIQNVGSIVSIPIAPYIADPFGRKAGIIIGSTIVLAGSLLQGFTQNFGMFIGARLMVGFGTTFAQLASPLLVTEIAYPSQRAQLTSLYNTLWFSGSIVAAWTTFGTFRIANDWSWRIPSLLQGLSSVIQLLFVWFIPESPRWLVSKGREDQARAILARYHAGGDMNHPLIEYEFNEIKEALALEAESAKTSWLDLIRSAGNRRRLRIILAIAVFSQWSGNGLISYYLAPILDTIGITSQADQTLLNGILAIYNFIIAITASMVVEKAGRRPMFLTANAGMLVAYAVITATSAAFEGNPLAATGRTQVAFIFIFNGFYAIAYTPLLVSYTVEILPFLIRAKGLACMNFGVVAAIIFNQYTNPIALKALKWKYYLIYTIWLIFELGYIWLYLVETKGRSLEETAALFDGDEAVRELTDRTHADIVETGVLKNGSSVDEKLGSEHNEVKA